MPLSYKAVKRPIIHSQMDEYKIPIIPPEGLQGVKKDKKASLAEKKLQEKSHRLIDQAQNKAKAIIENAILKSQTIKEEAEEKGYQAGYEKGLDTGYSEGYEKANRETKDLKENARLLLENAHKASREYIKNMDEEILNLSASIAKSIIHLMVDTREEHIVEMVKNALKLAEERKQITLRCHPNSVLVLQTNLYQFKKICPNANFTFLEDREVEECSCLIDTEEQVIDLDINKQLENMISTLLEEGEDNEL